MALVEDVDVEEPSISIDMRDLDDVKQGMRSLDQRIQASLSLASELQFERTQLARERTRRLMDMANISNDLSQVQELVTAAHNTRNQHIKRVQTDIETYGELRLQLAHMIDTMEMAGQLSGRLPRGLLAQVQHLENLDALVAAAPKQIESALELVSQESATVIVEPLAALLAPILPPAADPSDPSHQTSVPPTSAPAIASAIASSSSGVTAPSSPNTGLVLSLSTRKRAHSSTDSTGSRQERRLDS
ncbi:hypothetical protein CAOG_01127 [Capsaspora owczarzaki ATCC 30864]|nr:hypothetical protein CAOG_01127 [Capsaspora owczarzaki ATCC 30864]|eukprot:XP_004365998.2 hypothetical protein CAOG_01127 [Capsaspora owczarzaki ATCC 30864]